MPGFLFPSEVTPNYRTMNQYQITENATWNRGRHTFKFGADLRQIRTAMFYTGDNGSWGSANRYTGDNLADYLMGFASSVSKTARATLWGSRINYGGLYFQDDWKVTQCLTLNLGLRWEVEGALKQSDRAGLGWDVRTSTMLVSEEATNRAAIESFYRTIRPEIAVRFVPEAAPYNTDWNNFQPRVGFAYMLAAKYCLARRRRDLFRLAADPVDGVVQRFCAQYAAACLDGEPDCAGHQLQPGGRDGGRIDAAHGAPQHLPLHLAELPLCADSPVEPVGATSDWRELRVGSDVPGVDGAESSGLRQH